MSPVSSFTLEELVDKNPELKLLSKAKLYNRLQNLGHTHIKKADVDAFLNPKEITQIYARPRYTNKSSRFKITAPPYSFQIDIALLPAYKSSNKGIDKFFIAVDILSRKAFAYPLKDGKMSTLLKVYEQFLIDAGAASDIMVNSVAGDAFFDNAAFKSMNEDLYISVYTDVSKDDHITKMGSKLGIVDRCIRTLKQLIQKFMLANDTTRWTQFLSTVLELYNSTPHSGIKNMTPDEVYDDYDYMMGLYKAQSKRNQQINSKISVEPGNLVRTMVGKGIFDKEKAKFSTTIYTVLRQEGYRFVLSDDKGQEVKRRYRPNELLVVKDALVKDSKPERIKTGKTKINESKHTTTLGVARALGATYKEANKAIRRVDEPRQLRKRWNLRSKKS